MPRGPGRKLVAMESHRMGFVLAAILSLCAALNLLAAKPGKESRSAAADSASAFLGRWDLTLKSADREYPSWLEISEENGQLKAQMVGRWGNARPLPKVELSDGHLIFVSPKAEEDRPDDMIFKGTLVGGTLSGTTTGPDGTTWLWTGQKAPALKASGSPKWGKPMPLF